MSNSTEYPNTGAMAFIDKHPAQESVKIIDWQGNNRAYSFPTLFAQTSAINLVYSADYVSVKKLLPRQVPNPVRISKNRCLVTFTLFQYGSISDNMEGYNEFVVGTFVSKSRIPLLPAILRNSFESTCTYVFDMPVDAEENCHRGNEIWGLPKTMKKFDVQRTDDHLHCRVSDQGHLCYEISSPLKGKNWFTTNERNRSLSVDKNGSTQASDIHIHSNEQRFFSARSPFASQVEIKFGMMETHAKYRHIGLSEKPLITRHLSNMNSALYAPKSY